METVAELISILCRRSTLSYRIDDKTNLGNMETRIYTLRLDVENPNRIKDPKPFSTKQSIKFIVARTIQAWTLV